MSDRVTESSGASFIKIQQNSVIQTYNPSGYQRAMKTLKTLLADSTVICEIIVNAGYGSRATCQSDFRETLKFDIFDYLVKPLNFLDHRQIEYERIIPLIEYNTKYRGYDEWKSPKEQIRLLWHIGLALYGLHQKGIIHGDTTLDNIGFRKSDNHYVLYDFDSTRPYSDDHKLDDYAGLMSSIEFHTNEKSSLMSISNFLVEIIKMTKKMLNLNDCHDAFDLLVKS